MGYKYQEYKPGQHIEGTRWTIIDLAPPKIYGKNKKLYKAWYCRCDCGREKIVMDASLQTHGSLSCGCMHRKKYKNNTYRIEGDITYVADVTGKEFIIDTADLELIKPYYWRVDRYILTNSNGRTLYLHRLLTGVTDGKQADHINGNSKDNRRANLRVCTQQQNAKNRKMYRNNHSGCKGVRWSVEEKKWIAQITIEGKLHILGRFDLFDDAVQIRKAAEQEVFGEYNRDEKYL